MLFLRVEHGKTIDTATGIHAGPYRSSYHDALNEQQSDELHDMSSVHSNPFTHPVMHYEFDLEYFAAKQWCCGFIGAEQAIQWFEGYFKLLDEIGFMLSAYDLNSVQFAEKQAICLVSELKRATPISVYPLALLNSISGGIK
jgi:hypothetical protein